MTLTLELAGLTGLDAPSVDQQVIPHLHSYTEPEPLRVYLESLVGTSVTARSFIQNYLITRFGSAQRHHKPRASPVPPPPASSSGNALSSVSQPGSNRSSQKGKSRQADPTEAEALQCLTPEELGQVQDIDRGLRLLSLPNGHPLLQKSKCFCQGRRHLLSSYVRLCPSCGLVLCALNLPSRPCPSCLAGPLLTGQQLLSHKTAQLNRREAFLAEGRERFTLAQQVDYEERQRMRFPSLADRANGLTDVQHRINNAYTTPADQDDDRRRVLSLDLKTKKVSSTTTRRKATTPAGASGSNADDELGLNQMQGWIDPTDDGYAQQVKEGKAPAVPAPVQLTAIHFVPREEDDQVLADEDEEQEEGDDDEDDNAGVTAADNDEGDGATKTSKAQQGDKSKKKGKDKTSQPVEGSSESTGGGNNSKRKGKGKSQNKVPGQA